MKTFFLYLFCCLAVPVTLARPEPPSFMELQQQHQRTLPLNTPSHAEKSYIYQQLPEEHSFANFVGPSTTFDDLGSPSSADTFDLSALKTTAVEMPQEDSYNVAYRHSSSQQHQTGYESGPPTETQVHKHIYIHVPPKDFEDEDAIQPRVTHQVGSKQKHYKIIFIKTPTVPAIRTPIVSPRPQQEEKTLIYVLHKKPELLSNIVIPTPEPTKPSKPEVYFIKYKATRDEAPVYGPPPAINDFKPRQALENEANDFRSMDLSDYEMMTTTQQPQYLKEEEQQTQFFKEEPSEVGVDFFNASTETNLIHEEMETTTIEPHNQQLSAETTTIAPIVVKEMQDFVRVPSTSYGAPNRSRLIIKKRK